MSNLIPTPRVDKNGKVVIRHVKSDPAKDPKPIPAPFGKCDVAIGSIHTPGNGNFITRWKNRRRRNKADKTLVNTLFPDKNALYAGVSPQRLVESLERTLSTHEVELAGDVAKLVTRNGVSKEDAYNDRKHLIWALRTSLNMQRNTVQVRALHAHKQWLEDNPGDADKLCNTIDALIEFDMIPNNGNDGIPHVDAYVAACQHRSFGGSFEVVRKWRKDYLNAIVRRPEQTDDIAAYIIERGEFVEEGFEDFLNAAAKHPDKRDRMFDYIKERGEFDEEGFEQYLNTATPLAEGAL